MKGLESFLLSESLTAYDANQFLQDRIQYVCYFHTAGCYDGIHTLACPYIDCTYDVPQFSLYCRPSTCADTHFVLCAIGELVSAILGVIVTTSLHQMQVFYKSLQLPHNGSSEGLKDCPKG